MGIEALLTLDVIFSDILSSRARIAVFPGDPILLELVELATASAEDGAGQTLLRLLRSGGPGFTKVSQDALRSASNQVPYPDDVLQQKAGQLLHEAYHDLYISSPGHIDL